MKQIGIDQVKQLGSQLENLNSAIDANDNSIIELNNILEEKQDTLIAGEGIIIEDNVISISGSSKSALQVTCSYNDDVLKGVAVVVDETTITTKSNGLATFTGLDSGVKMVTANKDGYRTTPPIPAILENPFEVMSLTLQPVTLTFTVKDVENNVIVGATITVGDYTATTNDNGQAVISGILDGVYTYTITKATFTNATGIISINRQNVNQPVVMTSALIVGKSSGSYSVGDTVKLNAGVGENNYDFTAYPSDTTQTNDLTIDGEVAEVKTDSILLTEEPQIENAEITIEVDQDNADIQFNNSNDICTVNIVADMKQYPTYLAFKRQSDDSMIYFKGGVAPFTPNGVEYSNTSFTYYTYTNNVMTSHTATTQSSTVGVSSYDGYTLTIYSETIAVAGTYTRTPANDLKVTENFEDATITTSGYLTTPQAVIPRENYWRFAVEKLNTTQWLPKIIVAGTFVNLANLQEIVVPNNTKVEIYNVRADKANSPEIIMYSYYKTFNITNDRIYRKVKYSIRDVNSQNFNVVLTVNGVAFEFTGSCSLDVFAGETVYYTISKSGYVTQTGSYTVPDYPTITEQIQEITLTANTVTLTVNDGSAALNGATVVIGENTYTSDSSGNITLSQQSDGIYNYTASFSNYPTITGSFIVAGANVSKTISISQGDVTLTITDSSSNSLENVLISFRGNSYTTDSNGQVVMLNVDYGTYNYTAFLNGYAKKTGDIIVVNNSQVTKTITLVANYNN